MAKINDITEFCKTKVNIRCSEVQRKFGITQKEAKSLLDQLVEKKILSYNFVNGFWVSNIHEPTKEVKLQVPKIAVEKLEIKPSTPGGVVSINDYLVTFGEKMRLGIDAIRYAAKVYAQALLKFPTEAMTKFTQMYPDVSGSTWDLLERIGNGALHPRAILLPYTVADKISKIPIARQNKMFADNAKGFQVVSVATRKAHVVPIASITPSQASLLIDMENGKIRSVEEQIKLIDNSMITDHPRNRMKGSKPHYQIIGNVVRIGGVEIGKETLRNILNELEERTSS